MAKYKYGMPARTRLETIKSQVDEPGSPAEERLAAIGALVADMGKATSNSHAANVRQILPYDLSRVRALMASLQDLNFDGHANARSPPAGGAPVNAGKADFRG